MNTKETILSVLFITIFSIYGKSQVGGISASKIGTYCVATVPHKDIEFEPALSISKSTRKWNSNSEIERIYSTRDSLDISSELSFRFTYGLTKKLEIGMSVPMDVSVVNWGIKQIILEKKNIGIAVIGGVNSPIHSGTYDKSGINRNNTSSIAIGVVLSYMVNNSLLIDFDIQTQKNVKKTECNNNMFVNSDIGYYISNHCQIIMGLSYYSSLYYNNKLNSNLLFANPGISYETGDDFLIVVSSPLGLYGKNHKMSFSLNVAFTMIIK